MALQGSQILERLQANYQKAAAMMPPDLAAEFQRRIITTGDLKQFSQTILVATQIKNETVGMQIQNRILEQFNFRGFGTRLAKQGVNPNAVYEQLLQGFFDYKK
jgi:hypothetical protein